MNKQTEKWGKRNMDWCVVLLYIGKVGIQEREKKLKQTQNSDWVLCENGKDKRENWEHKKIEEKRFRKLFFMALAWSSISKSLCRCESFEEKEREREEKKHCKYEYKKVKAYLHVLSSIFHIFSLFHCTKSIVSVLPSVYCCYLLLSFIWLFFLFPFFCVSVYDVCIAHGNNRREMNALIF